MKSCNKNIFSFKYYYVLLIIKRVVHKPQAARMKNYELWSQLLFCCIASHEYIYIRSINSAIAPGHSLSEASSIRRIRQPGQHQQSKQARYRQTCTQKHTNEKKGGLFKTHYRSRNSLINSALHILLTSCAFTSALAPIRSAATDKRPSREAHMSEVYP